MRLKPGVSLLGLTPQSVVGMIVVASVYASHGADAVITSGSDGSHKLKSKHYIGNAFDVRTNGLAAEVISAIMNDLVAALPGFFVLFEGDHIHVQWDPDGKAP